MPYSIACNGDGTEEIAFKIKLSPPPTGEGSSLSGASMMLKISGSDNFQSNQGGVEV